MLLVLSQDVEEKLSEATKLEIKNTTMIDSDILIEADVIK